VEISRLVKPANEVEMAIKVDRLDHVVVNSSDVAAMAAWYARVLGMEREEFGPERRTALKFGNQKLNLRPTGAANWATAAVDTPGSLDFCFITKAAPEQTLAHLAACGVAVAAGPVERTGALGAMTSIYCRDPDGNLVEIASYR
jgi:catechol 2,3-dioxygenase-like lactoylglutathione lyase family enzyme